MRRALVTLLAAWIGLVVCCPCACAASLTWGYNYQRTRQADVSVPTSIPAEGTSPQDPWVVPLPGRSQSTPIGTATTAYFFTHSSTGGVGWLWQIPFQNGIPSQALDITPSGPGTGPAAFIAQPGETFAAPADPSLSPSGTWLAIGVGSRLFWSQHQADGAWGTWHMVRMAGTIGQRSMVSEAPSFVPGANGKSEFVCEGDWNGGFGCYDLESGVPAVLFITSSDRGDRGQLTSSPALLPDGQECFGVASLSLPRVVCVDPRGGLAAPIRQFGAGTIEGPIDASTVYDAGTGDLLVQDQWSDVYLFDPVSGRLLHESLLCHSNRSCAVTVVSPAVGTDGMAVVASDGGSALVALNAETLQRIDDLHPPTGLTSAVGWGGALSSPTFQGTSVWVYADSAGVLWMVKPTAVNGVMGGGRWLLVPPNPSRSRAFSAVVLGIGPNGNAIALWSDEARCAWSGSGCGKSGKGVDPHVIDPPKGFSDAESPGGLELWQEVPAMLAWATPDPLTTSAPYWVFTLTGPGITSVRVTDGTSVVAMRPVERGSSLPTTMVHWSGGVVMLPNGSQAMTVASLDADYASAISGGLMDGAYPGVFGAYALWGAGPFVSPDRPGPQVVQFAGQQVGDTVSTLTVTLHVDCPLGEERVGAACAAPPCASDCTAERFTSQISSCPISTSPNAGLTAAEEEVLCGIPKPYLTDGTEVRCDGSVWDRERNTAQSADCSVD